MYCTTLVLANLAIALFAEQPHPKNLQFWAFPLQ